MGVLSFLIIFASGAIFGTAALVIGLIVVLNVGADSLEKQREKSAEKRKKYSHLDAKKWLPKPRTVQVVAAAATRTRARAASVSVSGPSSVIAQPALLLRKLVIELLESTNFPLGASTTIDAAVRIRLGEQKTKTKSLPKSVGLAKVRNRFRSIFFISHITFIGNQYPFPAVSASVPCDFNPRARTTFLCCSLCVAKKIAPRPVSGPEASFAFCSSKRDF
jgi:hypothetical protein